MQGGLIIETRRATGSLVTVISAVYGQMLPVIATLMHGP